MNKSENESKSKKGKKRARRNTPRNKKARRRRVIFRAILRIRRSIGPNKFVMTGGIR